MNQPALKYHQMPIAVRRASSKLKRDITEAMLAMYAQGISDALDEIRKISMPSSRVPTRPTRRLPARSR